MVKKWEDLGEAQKTSKKKRFNILANEIADIETGNDIANGAITTSKLATAAVETGKIKDGAVTRGKIASQVVPVYAEGEDIQAATLATAFGAIPSTKTFMGIFKDTVASKIYLVYSDGTAYQTVEV